MPYPKYKVADIKILFVSIYFSLCLCSIGLEEMLSDRSIKEVSRDLHTRSYFIPYVSVLRKLGYNSSGVHKFDNKRLD